MNFLKKILKPPWKIFFDTQENVKGAGRFGDDAN